VEDKIARFEHAVLPHLDAAYNLARWLTRDVHDAEDLVQEACLRALKSFGGFRGGNARQWLLSDYQGDVVVLLVRAELPNIINNRFKQGL
jgi:hypothetical protein